MKLNLTVFTISLLVLACGLSQASTEQKSFEKHATEAISELDCVIEPSEVVDIGPAVSGIIKSIHLDRSDQVKKGSIVFQLESDVEQANVNLASVRAKMDSALQLRKVSLVLGYITENRNKELFSKSAISQHDMDQVNTDIKIAELNLRQEEDNKQIASLEFKRALAKLEQRTVKSPVDGVVMERFKSVGEHVDDEPVLRIAKLDPLHVEVIIPVDYLGAISTGMMANVTLFAGGKDAYLATVERIDQVMDAASGTFGVRLNLPNPNYQIPAGMRCVLDFLPQENVAPMKLTEAPVDY